MKKLFLLIGLILTLGLGGCVTSSSRSYVFNEDGTPKMETKERFSALFSQAAATSVDKETTMNESGGYSRKLQSADVGIDPDEAAVEAAGQAVGEAVTNSLKTALGIGTP